MAVYDVISYRAPFERLSGMVAAQPCDILEENLEVPSLAKVSSVGQSLRKWYM